MAIQRSHKTMMPLRLHTAGIAFTVAVFATAGWLTWTSQRMTARIAADDLRLQEFRGKIIYLDEVLTMSARMAAATGDAAWEARYQKHASDLDEAIQRAIDLAPDTYETEAATQTDEANRQLVAMEERAFEWVCQGERDAASALLYGAEYERQKELYAEGMAKFDAALEERIRTNIAAMSDRTSKAGLLCLVAIGVLIAVWFVVFVALRNYLKRRLEAEESLIQLQRVLEQRVQERTIDLTRSNRDLEAEIAMRRQAQEELSNAMEFADNINKSMADMLLVVSPDNRITAVNEATCRLLGYSKEELVGQPTGKVFLESKHDTSSALVSEHVAATDTAPPDLLVENQRTTRLEKPLRMKSGAKLPALISSAVMRSESGDVLGTVHVAQDITERKRVETELARVNQELIHASREAGIAEMATGVLHNIGNALTGVNTTTHCLEEKVRKSKVGGLARAADLVTAHAGDLADFITKDERGKHLPAYLCEVAGQLTSEQEGLLKDLQSLTVSVEHINNIVAMQQTHAKATAIREKIDFAEMLDQVVHLQVDSLERRGIEVVREFDEVSQVSADKHKLLQILLNLVRNASHAMIASDRRDRRLTLRLGNDGDQVCIEVADNGVGIEAEHLTKIFSHGFTTKKDGHGFGLHSAALAAEEMGGSLSVCSEGAGNGAMFTLRIPTDVSIIHQRPSRTDKDSGQRQAASDTKE